MSAFEIVYPSNLQEAILLLDPDDPAVRPVGGGTALMLMMRSQLFEPRRLVCLSRLREGLANCRLGNGGDVLHVGAMTTFAALENSPVVARYFPSIRDTMRTLANVRIRNVATVGGNLAHGDPHLDLPPLWVALGAEATIVGRKGERVVPVEDIFRGYYETAIADGEIVTGLMVPIQPGWRASYTKVTTRVAHDWPALGLSIALLMKSGAIADSRVVLSAATDRPTRLRAAEAALMGRNLDTTTFTAAGEAATAEAELRDDDRASADYKAQLLRVHLARSLRALIGS